MTDTESPQSCAELPREDLIETVQFGGKLEKGDRIRWIWGERHSKKREQHLKIPEKSVYVRSFSMGVSVHVCVCWCQYLCVSICCVSKK